MNVVNQSEDINVNVSLIFDLINNVDKYSSFLPWCSNSSILSNSSSEMTAEIEIAGKPITWKFKTKNNYKVNEIIKIKLVDGPFKNLEGYWKFNSIDDHNTSVVV